MIQSEIYEIVDAIFYDSGIQGTANNNWYNDGLTVDLTSETYTEISKTTSNTGYYLCNIGDTPSSTSDITEFNSPFAIEFDILGYSDSGGLTGLYFNDGSTSGGHLFNGKFSNNETHHIKEVVTSTKISMYVDDEPTPFEWVKSFNNPMRLGLRVASTCSIKFKNFKIYPI